MRIAVLKERWKHEKRVAVSPDTVKRYCAMGLTVTVEKGAGEGAGFTDAAYAEAGATVPPHASEVVLGADIVLCVRRPMQKDDGEDVLGSLPDGAVLVGMLEPLTREQDKALYQNKNITSFSLESIPRISRAQSMDVLSSQSNLAGYRAVIEAVSALDKATPMMMTAAGTVAPAKVLVLGAGVAGLQAIATAKRLGAVVSAFDVRAAVKEQVESLGGKFIEVESDEAGETSGGYAKEMSEDYQKRQQEKLAQEIPKQDIIITTALIPGRPAPVLVPEALVKAMRPGSVIVDMAASAGGNCPLTKPDSVTTKHGVKLIGYTDLPSRVARDASQLYARNLFNFIALLYGSDGKASINWEDEIIATAAFTRGEGKPLAPASTEE